MKTKQVSLAILTSMTLFACSNNEDVNAPSTDNAPKTVVLKLDGIASASSRSNDANTTDDATGKKVNLNDIKVIFYTEGGYVTFVDDIASTETEEWNSIVNPTGNGKRYENIPATTDHVMVIGNFASLPETNKSQVTVGASIASIQSMEIPLSSQNTAGTGTDKTTKANITLYGTGALTPFESPAPGDEGLDVYQAEVSIKPIISRIEITGISCDFTTPAGEGSVIYSSVNVKGIGLFDYYNTMTLDGTNVSDMMDASKIYSPAETSAPGGAIYKFLDATATDWTWAFDQINSETGFTSTTLTGSGKQDLKKTDDANATFAYNFFPATTNIESTAATADQKVLANVRLLVDATLASGTEEKNNYVVTTSFKDAATGGSIVAPEPGKIYQFAYAFKQNNIREEWDADKMVVYVKVKVLEWDIVPVTPSF